MIASYHTVRPSQAAQSRENGLAYGDGEDAGAADPPLPPSAGGAGTGTGTLMGVSDWLGDAAGAVSLGVAGAGAGTSTGTVIGGEAGEGVGAGTAVGLG